MTSKEIELLKINSILCNHDSMRKINKRLKTIENAVRNDEYETALSLISKSKVSNPPEQSLLLSMKVHILRNTGKILEAWKIIDESFLLDVQMNDENIYKKYNIPFLKRKVELSDKIKRTNVYYSNYMIDMLHSTFIDMNRMDLFSRFLSAIELRLKKLEEVDVMKWPKANIRPNVDVITSYCADISLYQLYCGMMLKDVDFIKSISIYNVAINRHVNLFLQSIDSEDTSIDNSFLEQVPSSKKDFLAYVSALFHLKNYEKIEEMFEIPKHYFNLNSIVKHCAFCVWILQQPNQKELKKRICKNNLEIIFNHRQTIEKLKEEKKGKIDEIEKSIKSTKSDRGKLQQEIDESQSSTEKKGDRVKVLEKKLGIYDRIIKKYENEHSKIIVEYKERMDENMEYDQMVSSNIFPFLPYFVLGLLLNDDDLDKELFNVPMTKEYYDKIIDEIIRFFIQIKHIESIDRDNFIEEVLEREDKQKSDICLTFTNVLNIFGNENFCSNYRFRLSKLFVKILQNSSNSIQNLYTYLMPNTREDFKHLFLNCLWNEGIEKGKRHSMELDYPQYFREEDEKLLIYKQLLNDIDISSMDELNLTNFTVQQSNQKYNEKFLDNLKEMINHPLDDQNQMKRYNILLLSLLYCLASSPSSDDEEIERIRLYCIMSLMERMNHDQFTTFNIFSYFFYRNHLKFYDESAKYLKNMKLQNTLLSVFLVDYVPNVPLFNSDVEQSNLLNKFLSVDGEHRSIYYQQISRCLFQSKFSNMFELFDIITLTDNSLESESMKRRYLNRFQSTIKSTDDWDNWLNNYAKLGSEEGSHKRFIHSIVNSLGIMFGKSNIFQRLCPNITDTDKRYFIIDSSNVLSPFLPVSYSRQLHEYRIIDESNEIIELFKFDKLVIDFFRESMKFHKNENGDIHHLNSIKKVLINYSKNLEKEQNISTNIPSIFNRLHSSPIRHLKRDKQLLSLFIQSLQDDENILDNIQQYLTDNEINCQDKWNWKEISEKLDRINVINEILQISFISLINSAIISLKDTKIQLNKQFKKITNVFTVRLTTDKKQRDMIDLEELEFNWNESLNEKDFENKQIFQMIYENILKKENIIGSIDNGIKNKFETTKHYLSNLSKNRSSYMGSLLKVFSS
ncbi:hypothetical protein SNEBB_003587 [Seison nebaliae]|nr:hypothetical protein SNEBB_003587 [Seison nebaliae]